MPPLDLARRSTEPELLDLGVADEDALRNLGDIRLVNRFLGGRRALCQALLPLLDGATQTSLLDVGCGSGDLPAELARRAQGRLLAVGLDLKLLHARQAAAGVQAVVADVRALPFRAESFDIVTASLFLHHFDDAELPSLLSRLYATARRALVVNDLHRARVPHAFARIVFPLLLRSHVSQVDGLISIRRGFRPAELERAFRDARIPNVRVTRSFPYRLLAVARKG